MFKPIFAPGINVLWRSKTQVQFGIDPTTSVRADSKIAAHLIAHCVGRLSIEEIVHSGTRDNLNSEQLIVTISKLLKVGLLTCESETLENQQFPQTAIEIQGAGRLGMTVAVLLAHTGFTNVQIHDKELVTLADVTAWGASRVDVGARRDHTALMIIERIQRGVWPRMLRVKNSGLRRLVIMCPDQVGRTVWFAPDLTDAVIASDQPHLVAGAGITQALVSTVLNPSHTACLRCHNSRLTDMDPAWPLLSSQLIGRPTQDLAPAQLLLYTASLVVDIVCEWAQQPRTCSSGLWQIEWPGAEKTFNPINTHAACGCQWNRVA